MFNIKIISLALVFTMALSGMKCPGNDTAPAVTSKQEGIAVVELFTSEGCSSCPSADAAMIALVKKYPANVYVLGFHVDYWNRLGWKDPFSDAAYSARQGAYATQFKLQGVYTPQVLVNGKKEFVGSDTKKLEQVVQQELNTAYTHTLTINKTVLSGNMVEVDFHAAASNDQVINIALVQLKNTSQVKRGENEGRALEHINIVRDFKTVDAAAQPASVLLNLPSNADVAGYQVIAYVQHKKTSLITDAVTHSIL